MENFNEKNIITKSPGKSLLSGGYLILDKSKRGLVINTDTYITCESFIKYQEKADNNCLLINITSEYLNENFNYMAYVEEDEEKINEPNNKKEKIKELKITEKRGKENKWLKNCILSSLFIYLNQKENSFKKIFNKNKQLEINILIKSDYRFYSFSKDIASKNIKTGLGSSSALISSLTTNMILIYELLFKNKEYKNNILVKNIDEQNIKAIILGSCLLSNNLSQNKIGSCFDIISSLFGSQIFIQTQKNLFLNAPFYFNIENKNIINDIISYLKDDYIPNILFLNKDIHFLKNNICFISIEIGSDTRIFVKKVLEYANNKKIKNLFDDELFSKLNDINEQIINLFINNINNNELLKDLCKKYRNILRLISEESKVEIEPKILTPLLDKLIDNKKIIFSICPGAGGYDSIIILGNDGIDKEELNVEIKQIINEFNINNKNINIKANLLDVNSSQNFGTILN